jgi:hypothetical protein
MRNDKKYLAITYACVWLFMLNLVWMGLELLPYGEVQHRIVDDIIAIPILYSFYLNGLYYIERKYGE